MHKQFKQVPSGEYFWNINRYQNMLLCIDV